MSAYSDNGHRWAGRVVRSRFMKGLGTGRSAALES